MSQADIDLRTFTQDQAIELDKETYPKFRDLKSMFWIKLADFLDIVPRHPHLAGLRLRTRPMVLHEDPWGMYTGKAGKRRNGQVGAEDGEGRGGMVNGFR